MPLTPDPSTLTPLFHAVLITFVFALGACVGSFLNVVVWRLPRGESLVSPPSHCPKCNQKLAWYDNVPVFGWLWLRGRCRYCREPISPRYPIVEFLTGLIFAGYYVAFYVLHVGPCAPFDRTVITSYGATLQVPYLPTNFLEHGHFYLLLMFMMAGLLAATLIDAELFIIPPEIPWLIAALGLIFHALFDAPTTSGALNLLLPSGVPSVGASLAAGGGVGLLISILLWWRGLIPTSFPDGEPMELDQELYAQDVADALKRGEDPPPEPRAYTRPQIRTEIYKEIAFLLPPTLLAFAWFLLTQYIAPVRTFWAHAASPPWVSGLLGAVLGALVGALVVWLARILGTLGFGRVAMGLGDVHLMFGVGAVVGAGPATLAFFLAPFAGLVIGLYNFFTKSRRELPFGPYLSLATAAVLLCYCPIADYLRPGFEGLYLTLDRLLSGGAAAGRY